MMRRRTFCKSTIAVAVAATLPACGSRKTGAGSMIPAVTSSGAELSIESAAVEEFAASLQGNLFLQGD